MHPYKKQGKGETEKKINACKNYDKLTAKIDHKNVLLMTTLHIAIVPQFDIVLVWPEKNIPCVIVVNASTKKVIN